MTKNPKVLVVGFETEWAKYFDSVFVLPELKLLEFKLQDGKLTIFNRNKIFEPDVIIYRKPATTSWDKRFLLMLQDFDGRVINKPEAILRTNQLYNSLMCMKKAGIKVPKTTCFFGPHLIDENKLQYPLVIKTEGEHAGQGKALIKSKEELKEALNLLTSDSKKYVLQEWLDVIRDFRVLVIGNKVAGIVNRRSDDWKKSTGEAEEVHFSIPELEKVALKAAKCLGAEFAGVDVLETEKGYYVVEVNTEPGIECFEDVAVSALAEYVKK